ncbi:mynd domain [Diplodia corticola]|uniref:Mynd domain n=1 Tax=Diplodia corticola TaxID=236234 RepID=A0A1J9QRD8_9PEZI|nr:mynd domain [Diplodia corticola]OJD31510.1 mynd domain [Diplodia corticola]
MADNSNDTTCASCGKVSDDLKRCAKCHSERYCNRDCQKAHWKTHKKVCASRAANAAPPTAKNLDVPITNPFTRLTTRTWLHDRSERDTYKLLIDAYRMRMDDQYKFEGDIDADCVMGGEVESSIGGFTRFLLKLHRAAPQLLPPWWTPQKEEACKSAGMRHGAWESLRATPEKEDFIEHYGDSRMPMQLRMFAEAVYGSGPGGQSGKMMMEMMASTEEGGERSGGHADVLDTSAFLASFAGR